MNINNIYFHWYAHCSMFTNQLNWANPVKISRNLKDTTKTYLKGAKKNDMKQT